MAGRIQDTVTLLWCVFAFLGFHMVSIACGILFIMLSQLKQTMLPSVLSVENRGFTMLRATAPPAVKMNEMTQKKIRSIYCLRVKDPSQ